jgi:osmotically-inducible protein OsmY
MERVSGEDFCEHMSASNVPVGRPADPPSQFEFGAEDKHNWKGRSDERIKLAVMTMLHWDLAVPRDRVRVSVDREWVTLTGQVVRAYEKPRAEVVARMTPGVAGVTNAITFLPGD